MQFVVFHWQNGKWIKPPSSKSLQPGDPVSFGQSSSGLTLIDVRKDNRGGITDNNDYILLMDDRGVISQRDPRTDAADPEFLRLQKIAVPAGAPLPPSATAAQ